MNYFVSLERINTIEKIELIYENTELVLALNDYLYESNYSDTLLYLSLQYNQFNLTEWLVQHGANVNLSNLMNNLISDKNIESINELLKYNPLVSDEDKEKIKKLIN